MKTIAIVAAVIIFIILILLIILGRGSSIQLANKNEAKAIGSAELSDTILAGDNYELMPTFRHLYQINDETTIIS